jgi:hypothetical protein
MKFRTAAFAPVLGALALVLSNVAAAAAFDPYTSGTVGYDYSYVQCGAAAPSASFGIVGVNAGYPFTYYNSCLGTEYGVAARTGNAALYVNTGYDSTYTAIDGRHTTQACADSSSAIGGTPTQQMAWAVGCSEAERDLSYASAQSANPASAWWLDVETANSWSSSDLSLNRYTIQGIVDRLRLATTVPVGIYSTSYQWNVITGGYQAAVDANWVATGQRTLRRARGYCGSTGFTGARIWLVQYVTTIDNDYVC